MKKLNLKQNICKHATPLSYRLFLVALFILITNAAFAQSVQIGAYYFDGWGGDTVHLNNKLKYNYPERQPIWGWITSTPDVMGKQIDAAANAGLAFFNFDWYYPKENHRDFNHDALNHALNLYLNAPNKNKLKFCITVCIDKYHQIGPEDWPALTQAWIELFKDPQYLTINGKPVINFLSHNKLMETFGSTEAVRNAMASFKARAQEAGLPGVVLATCVTPVNPDAIGREARACGFDFLTNYSFASMSSFSAIRGGVPVDNLINLANGVWSGYQRSSMPCIPTMTLGFDPRPWADGKNSYSRQRSYSGYTPASIYRSVSALKNWIIKNPQFTSREGIGYLYAWNEYGEGAWLTPSSNGVNMLDGVRRALVGQ